MNVPIILGSDAHISFDIANYENALPLLKGKPPVRHVLALEL